MLDVDLAALYGVETRALNQAVRRHLERFPPDFMFELERREIARISQSVISSRATRLKFSKRVTAFTENGVAMLSSVLSSPGAIQANIAIMRAFTRRGPPLVIPPVPCSRRAGIARARLERS